MSCSKPVAIPTHDWVSQSTKIDQRCECQIASLLTRYLHSGWPRTRRALLTQRDAAECDSTSWNNECCWMSRDMVAGDPLGQWVREVCGVVILRRHIAESVVR